MRRILTATHGGLAEGLKQAMSFILGRDGKVGVLGAYTTPDSDMDREVTVVVDELENGDELIVMTDALGGSVASASSGHISYPGTYILVGVSTSILLVMVPTLESAVDTQELVIQGIQAAREGCVLTSGLMRQASKESEEDSV